MMDHMDWTAGYASDVEYTSGFYREQSPSYLNFVCLVNGFEPVPLNRPFTYFELGFGRGFTVNLQAASNPLGQFYAADFNPAHVSGARQLAESAQLRNLTLLEHSFAELAEGKVADLPQFDFITLHGVYTWVSAENRQNIVNFIARYLKPGGIVYLSYNALPGWAAAQPLQRLLLEHADLYPNRSDLQIELAKKFVDRLNDLQAAYFVQNPGLKTRLQTLKSSDANYLVHEYMHRHWQPMYHADVARDLAGAKLDFVASAELSFAYPSFYLTPEKLELIDGIPDSALRETVKDYLLNTGFRKDVFVRGARLMAGARHDDCLRQTGLALIVARAQVSLNMKLAIGEVNAEEDLYGPVLDALAKRPHALGELVELHALKGQTLKTVTQIAAFLTASGQASPYFIDNSPIAVEPAHGLNRALALQARYDDDFQALASPLLGNGIAVTIVERLIYLVLSRQSRELLDVPVIVQQVWQIMAAQGRHLIKGGNVLSTDEENVAELHNVVAFVLTSKLPIWRHLKML